MKEIWIVEYCEYIDGSFDTRELAEEYVNKQPDPDMYYIYRYFIDA